MSKLTQSRVAASATVKTSLSGWSTVGSGWLGAAGHHILAGASIAVVIGRIGRLGARGRPNQTSQSVIRANVQHTRTEAVEVCDRPEGHEVQRVGSERLLHQLLAGGTRPRPAYPLSRSLQSHIVIAQLCVITMA